MANASEEQPQPNAIRRDAASVSDDDPDRARRDPEGVDRVADAMEDESENAQAANAQASNAQSSEGDARTSE